MRSFAVENRRRRAVAAPERHASPEIDVRFGVNARRDENDIFLARFGRRLPERRIRLFPARPVRIVRRRRLVDVDRLRIADGHVPIPIRRTGTVGNFDEHFVFAVRFGIERPRELVRFAAGLRPIKPVVVWIVDVPIEGDRIPLRIVRLDRERLRRPRFEPDGTMVRRIRIDHRRRVRILQDFERERFHHVRPFGVGHAQGKGVGSDVVLGRTPITGQIRIVISPIVPVVEIIGSKPARPTVDIHNLPCVGLLAARCDDRLPVGIVRERHRQRCIRDDRERRLFLHEDGPRAVCVTRSVGNADPDKVCPLLSDSPRERIRCSRGNAVFQLVPILVVNAPGIGQFVPVRIGRHNGQVRRRTRIEAEPLRGGQPRFDHRRVVRVLLDFNGKSLFRARPLRIRHAKCKRVDADIVYGRPALQIPAADGIARQPIGPTVQINDFPCVWLDASGRQHLPIRPVRHNGGKRGIR